MDYIREYVYDNFEITKIPLSDGCRIGDNEHVSATLTFKRGDPDEIVEYWSAEYEDNYDPYEHGPFEERFDNMFMNVDCPFELEKFDPRGHFSEQFCDDLFYASKMVKSRFNMDKIETYVKHNSYY